MKKLLSNRLWIFLCPFCFLFLFITSAQAVSFTTDLIITGQVEFDTGFALADGTVTQTGSFSRTAGGTSTFSTFNGTSVTGVNPVSGVLTDFDDGFGIMADVDSSFNSTTDSEFAIGLDIGIDVQNTSLTDRYQVTFKIDFSNAVNSSGDDAYADSEFTVDDASGEVFFTDLVSDTVNGNDFNGADPGGLGGPLSDSGQAFFDVIFEPNTMTTDSVTGAYTLEGGVFDPGSATANFSAFISVNNVVNLTSPPAPIPEPTTLILIGTGLTGLAAIRRRQKARR